ncbi:MAG TPA: alkaline phosphatase family protein [Ktedonobacteraceae bacterium]|nr:alkaline phosphatase family protein [Ktedonobacteraceae bacterium]
MARVVMIGIDGLDADLLRVYGPLLPHIRRLMLESPFLELKASFPPDTASTWASLYTGLNPSNHGIVSSEMQRQTTAARVAAAMEDGETFWEVASQAGKKVCVINPLLAYPASPMNKLMLTLPPVLPPPARLHTRIRHPEALCEALQTLTLQQAEQGLELFQREPWDLFYQQFDTLDYIQHALWHYSDPGDVAYPGRNKHAGRILDFYHLFDAIIGQFRSLMEPDDVLLVVSAHGHGRRCLYSLHLNEWLRRQGLLVARKKSTGLLHRHYIQDWTQYHTRELLAQRHVPDALSPSKRPMSHYTARLITQEETVAHVVELAGRSPFGGIALNRACIERAGKAYEDVRSTILHQLRQLRLKGRPAVYWAEVREHLYQGKYSEAYPDILFELQNEFGVSSALYGPLLTNNTAHSLLSGEHRMHGVCLLGNIPRNVNIQDSIQEPSVMDVAPTVLQLLDVLSANRNGQALVLPRRAISLPIFM